MYSNSFKEIKNQVKGIVAKYGKIAIEIHSGSFRLRWTHNKKTRTITIEGGITQEAYNSACGKAQLINADIALDRFDESLVKYDPKKAQSLEAVQTEPTLKDLWERYKVANAHNLAETTIKTSWKQVDNCLAKVSDRALRLSHADLLVPELLQHYSTGTLKRISAEITTCLNWSLETGKIDRKPKYIFPKHTPNKGTSQEIYSTDNLQRILKAIRNDEFKSPYTRYTHSWYVHFVEFFALTGRRPEDIIALTHEDIIERNGRMVMIVNKAYSKGVLKKTKNETVTIYPLNGEMLDCLTLQGKIDNPHNLIFPSQNLGYIDLAGFGRDIWKPLVSKLVTMGEVKHYCKFYSLRHLRATNLLRQGVDLQTISALFETSIEMLSQHYLKGNSEIELPNLLRSE
jgi:integrase